MLEHEHGEAFRRWVETERIDVVLSGSDRRPRYPIPCYDLDSAPEASSGEGIDQGQERLGAKAVDLLAEQLMRSRGEPRESCLTLLPARWR